MEIRKEGMIDHTSLENIFMAISKPTLVLELRGGDFIVAAANQAYLQITGTPLEEMLGKVSKEVFPKNPDGENS